MAVSLFLVVRKGAEGGGRVGSETDRGNSTGKGSNSLESSGTARGRSGERGKWKELGLQLSGKGPQMASSRGLVFNDRSPGFCVSVCPHRCVQLMEMCLQ